jgi:RNA recognition motif-containing protein
MSKKLYAGGLPYSVDNARLKEIFAPYGEVLSENVIMDKISGRSKGFGFVEMEEESANAAIQALNGKEYEGRTLTVNEARPMTPRTGSGFEGHRSGSGKRGGFGSGGNRGSRW